MALSILSPDSLDLTQDFAGIHLGGTGSANQLDDYETGTWTPTVSTGSVTTTTGSAYYVKIGTLVFAQARLRDFTDTTTVALLTIGGLPFTIATSEGTIGFSFTNNSVEAIYHYGNSGNTTVDCYSGGASYGPVYHSNLSSSENLILTLTYVSQ